MDDSAVTPTVDDDDDDYTRPRSFSDASINSGRHGYLQKVVDRMELERKTSMKVFVRRESQVISSSGKKQVAEVIPFQRSVRDDENRDSSYKYQNIDRSLPTCVQCDDIPPPKPALPKNYRLSLLESGKLTKANDSKTLQEPDAQSGLKLMNSSVKQNCLSDEQSNTDKRNQLISNYRQGRSSVSEAPVKSTSVLYRHFDPKYQSELLRKELDKLRTKEHVRRNSVKQKLESNTRPKSTGDLHVRFADDISDTKDTDKRSTARSGRRTLTRQSRSVVLPISGSHSDKTEDTRTEADVKLTGGKLELQEADPQGQKDSANVDRKVVKQLDSDTVRESRGSASQRERIPIRSKSASIYNRNRNDLTDSQDWKTLNLNPQNLSKSTSNLRRKQNTITKFNYDSVIQKRDNVRTRYHQSDKRNRIESLSPDIDDIPDIRTQTEKPGKSLAGGSTRHVGDNRSDEEKYAALSRQKIFHSKSSSWDSQPSAYVPRNIAQSDRQGVNKQTSVKPDLSKLSLQSFINAQSKSSKTGLVDRKGRQSRDVESPLSDSECYVTNGANKPKYSKTVGTLPVGGKIVLRQCRVGSDVVFGLVGLQKLSDREVTAKPNGTGYHDGQGLVTIRMIPDEQGRFGFNVKGGADQGMPIIVSRVAPNTPADNAIPRLNEGDQVLYINGRDVSQHTHEQVVVFIRQSRETRSKELKLIVRPNAYSGDDNSDEPDFVYDAETHQISSANGGANALDLSLKLLEESLESGAALAQFEQLYRKKPGMTMHIARLEANVPKNRYRDISPYDQTRVMIKNGPNGDYINANYVNMEIPVSGILNRYIAAQGPLPSTCLDFWQMIWEQQSTLVVMLTTKVERGRIKCHQYWPNLYETSDHGHLQITCVKEEETASFAFREFNLTNVETQEERHISHMQYIAWPDHGVPDDPADFLEFVQKVRQKRVGLVEPSIVHCSAGIGRTGVLITMETAMCLIEANQPVYPLSIVRQMRDQRAMLIQTPNQYKFVCEAIIRCYNEGLVKPLPEYQQR